MRMRVAGAHEFAAILKNLHVADPGDLREFRVLLSPGVDYPAQCAGIHPGNGEIVMRRKAQDSTEATIGLRNEQTVVLIVQRFASRQKRGKVVIEYICSRVFRCLLATSAAVAGAKIAVGIVGDRWSN